MNWTERLERILYFRLNYAIDAAFRRQGIHIPFPQRDLHIKSADGLARVLATVSES